VLSLYGRNVVTTEGADWRMHRKITSRPFSEANNQLVHDESIQQATEMMSAWESQSTNGSVVIKYSFSQAITDVALEKRR
jgi:cytochrome P450